MQQLKQIILNLQQTPQKGPYLSFLRVAISVWLIKEICFRWPAFEILYSSDSFLQLQASYSIGILKLNLPFIRSHYLLLNCSCIFFLLLNMLGIGKNMVSILAYLLLTLLYNISNQYANGGDEMALLMLLYLSFTNSYNYLSVTKQKPLGGCISNCGCARCLVGPPTTAQPRSVSPPTEIRSDNLKCTPLGSYQQVYNLVSNVAAYSIMINLCVGYFFSAVFKLENPYWQNGTAIHYILLNERFTLFSLNAALSSIPVFYYVATYSVLALELFFPVMVWQKQWRNIFLVMGLLMHTYIYTFMMIYGMSIVFILHYGLFLTDQEVLSAASKIKGWVSKPFIKNPA